MSLRNVTWTKVENENGFLYYINKSTNIRQWDHPHFTYVKQKLDECNYVKYSSYRVASKIRVLQHALYMDGVPLTIIAGVFERHRLGVTESSLCLESCDLEAVLTDVYFAANKQNHTNIDIDLATELMLTLLYNIYDKEREGKIQVSSAKLLLAILSNCQMSDLYHFVYNLCADHNNCITRLRLQVILSKLAEITTFMHEDVNFGQHLVNSSIEDCFRNSPGLVGINESSFTAWTETTPQFIAWIPTLCRMRSAESVVHSARCSVCGINPFKGLRYKCIRCTRYTVCQQCFLTGKMSKSHKLTHSMKEYCTEGGTMEFTRAVLKKLCSLLRCSVQKNFVTNVTQTKVVSEDKNELSKSARIPNDEKSIKPLLSPHMQLQLVIKQLEVQNSELQQMLHLSNRDDKEMKQYLEKHRLHIVDQIHKLKVLKEYLKVSQPALINQVHQLDTLQSTPLVANGRYMKTGLDMISPISRIPESSFIPESSQNRNELPSSCTGITDNETQSSSMYSFKDVSTWIGGKPSTSLDKNNQVSAASRKSPVRTMHNDLDDALAKLQQILATNFMLDESLENIDNGQLKDAVSEVEGMLTSFIDTVESSRSSSAQLTFPVLKEANLSNNYKYV